MGRSRHTACERVLVLRNDNQVRPFRTTGPLFVSLLIWRVEAYDRTYLRARAFVNSLYMNKLPSFIPFLKEDEILYFLFVSFLNNNPSLLYP